MIFAASRCTLYEHSFSTDRAAFRIFGDKGASVVWQIQDEHGVEDQLKSMGERVWANWSELVRPHLIEDPTHTNGNLEWDGTFDDQIGIPETDVWVTFESDITYVYLTGVVDIGEDSN